MQLGKKTERKKLHETKLAATRMEDRSSCLHSKQALLHGELSPWPLVLFKENFYISVLDRLTKSKRLLLPNLYSG